MPAHASSGRADATTPASGSGRGQPPRPVSALRHLGAPRTQPEQEPSQLVAALIPAEGDVSVDLASRTVRVRGRMLTLTRLEFDLLALLVATPRRVHTRAQLHESVWEGISSGGPRTVDVHVHRLRHKLGPAHEQHLVTVRGVGYRWDSRLEPRRPDPRELRRR